MADRKSQKQQIWELLSSRKNEWVPLYEIAPLATQYGCRIKELRADGHLIQNRKERKGAQVHSWFRLVVEEKKSMQGVSVPLQLGHEGLVSRCYA